MFAKNQLEKLLFFDIETVSATECLHQLSPSLQDLWKKRCLFLRAKHEDNINLSDEELYVNKAALHAEFNKIVTISFGRVMIDDSNNVTYRGNRICYDNETRVLTQLLAVLEKFFVQDYKLCGHNIKKFDIPVICKRLLINNMVIPNGLLVYDKKPWELTTIDTMDIWSFGSWQEGLVSLELICESLGLPNPKSDICGSEVTSAWYAGEHERIAEYCDNDVKALANFMLKISGFNLI